MTMSGQSTVVQAMHRDYCNKKSEEKKVKKLKEMLKETGMLLRKRAATHAASRETVA